MGLDAHVNCSCYKRGKVRTAPPKPEVVTVLPDGEVAAVAGTPLHDALAFDEWKRTACEHPGMVLVDHRIGNVAAVAFLRDELSKSPGKFPVILSKVLWSGTHTGDSIPVEFLARLRTEALLLKDVRATAPADQPFIDAFAGQMLELCDAALSVSHPIVF